MIKTTKITAISLFIILNLNLFAHSKTIKQYNAQINNLWKKKQYKRAIYTCITALKYYRNHAVLTGRLGYSYKLLRKYKIARKYLNKAYSMNKTNWMIKYWICDAYLASGWYAKTPLQRANFWIYALRINPNRKRYYLGVAQALSRANKHTRAMQWFNLAIKHKGKKGHKLSEILLYKAIAFIRIKNFKRALYFIEKAKKLAVNDVKLMETIASVYHYKLHMPVSTYKTFKFLIDKYPKHKNVKKWIRYYDMFRPMTLQINYKIKIKLNYIPYIKNNVVHINIYPINAPYYQFLSYKIYPDPVYSKILLINGNRYAKLKYKFIPPDIYVEVKAKFIPMGIRERKFLHFDDKTYNPMTYLKLNPKKEPDLYYYKILVKSITKNENNNFKKAKLIHKWMMKNFKYRLIGYKNLTQYLKHKKGECGGWAYVFSRLCRVAGIPARTVYGPFMGYPHELDLGSHVTSEFYIKGLGWIPVNNTANVFARIHGVFCTTRTRERKEISFFAFGSGIYNIRVKRKSFTGKTIYHYGSYTPKKISQSDFRTKILNKINNPEDLKFIKSRYKFSGKTNKYIYIRKYYYKNGVKRIDRKSDRRLHNILLSINYKPTHMIYKAGNILSVKDYEFRIYSLINLKKYTDAFAIAKKALQKFPSNPRILTHNGYIYKILRKYKTAVRFLKKAYEINKTDPIIKHRVCDAYLAAGWHARKPIDRANYWMTALKINPKHRRYYLGVAWALSRAGKHRQSLKWFNYALNYSGKKGNKLSVILLYRAKAYLRMKRLKDAKKDIIKAKRLDPHNSGINRTYKQILKK